MSDHDKEELDFVRRFLRCMEMAHALEKQPPGGAPDFLLRGDTGNIGLEVTRVHRRTESGGLARRQMEGIRETILRGAKKEWDRHGLPPVEVHCHFNRHRTPRPAELSATVHQLVEAVAAIVHLPEQWTQLRRSQPGGEGLPPAIHTVTVYRHFTIDESFWAGADSERPVDLAVSSVQERIDAKNIKLHQYILIGYPVWLLLVMDSHRFSGVLRVSSEVLEHRFLTGFEKTYLIDTWGMKVWQLKRADDGEPPPSPSREGN